MGLKNKQNIDRFLGPFICSVLTGYDRFVSLFKSGAKKTPELKNILIIKFWGMGSIVLASGGVNYIRKKLPGSRVIFLTMARNREILKSLDICDEIQTIEVDSGLIRLAVSIIILIIKLRMKKIDLVIDLEFFTRFSAIITYLTGAKVRGGFYDISVWRGYLHTIKVPFNRYWLTKKNFENLILECAGASGKEKLELVKPNISDSDKAGLSSVLAPYGITPSDGIITVNVNAGELAFERRWPKNHFVTLIKELLFTYRHKIVLIGSKSESGYVAEICEAVGDASVTNLSGILSTGMLCALLETSKVLITNDSGPLHLAAAIGTPTVSFFGPETPVLYGPEGKKDIYFYKSIDCSPCINVHNGKIVKCVRAKPECLENITPAEVMQKIKESGLLS